MVRNQNDIKEEQFDSVESGFLSRYLPLIVSISVIILSCCFEATLRKMIANLVLSIFLAIFFHLIIVSVDVWNTFVLSTQRNISYLNGVKYYHIGHYKGRLFYSYSNKEIDSEKFKMQYMRLIILFLILISLIISFALGYIYIVFSLVILETLLVFWDCFVGQKRYGIKMITKDVNKEDVVSIKGRLYYEDPDKKENISPEKKATIIKKRAMKLKEPAINISIITKCFNFIFAMIGILFIINETSLDMIIGFIGCSLFFQIVIAIFEFINCLIIKSGKNYVKETDGGFEQYSYKCSEEKITPERLNFQRLHLIILCLIWMILVFLTCLKYFTIGKIVMFMEIVFALWYCFFGQKRYGITLKIKTVSPKDLEEINGKLYYITSEEQTKEEKIEEDNINQKECIEEDNISQKEDIENIEEYMEKRGYNQRRMHRIILYLIGVLILLLIIFLYFNSLNNVAF